MFIDGLFPAWSRAALTCVRELRTMLDRNAYVALSRWVGVSTRVILPGIRMLKDAGRLKSAQHI